MTAARVRAATAAGRCRSSTAASRSRSGGVGAGGVDPAQRDLGEREDLPVEAHLDRDRPAEIVVAELAHRLEHRRRVAGLEPAYGERPAGAAAGRRHRATRQAPSDAQALLARGGGGIEMPRVVARPAELEQRPEQVVGVGGEPRDLDGGLAHRDRLRHPPLHLERVALDEHHRNEQPPLIGRARDRDAALGVRDRVVVALEVVLGPAQVVQRLQPRRQRRVGQTVDLLERLLAVLPRLRAATRCGLAERERRSGRRDQRAVAELRGRSRARRFPSSGSGRSRARTSRRPPARSGRPLPLPTRGRGGPPRPASDAGGPRRGARASARRRRTAPSARCVGPRRSPATSRPPRAVSSRHCSSSPTERWADASATRTSTWRASSSLGSSRNTAPNHRAAVAGAWGAVAFPAASRQRDRLLVARSGRLLDVMRALAGSRALRLERDGRPRMRCQAPAARRRLVHRAAHQRMAEAEPPWDACRPNEIDRKQARRAPPVPRTVPARRWRRRYPARTARRLPPRRRAADGPSTTGEASSSASDAATAPGTTPSAKTPTPRPSRSLDSPRASCSR